YFNTDSYDSRLYVNEQQLPHSFSALSVYGRGLRLSILARAMVGSHLQFDAKFGYTKYRDRTTIGTGLQQIDASHMTDLDVQARWRF
ncbi:MAG: helix-hairpin-helix domain-containing protein, partial [Prevotella sp.]|nr:helix-hairpin-helix domain-containing protein [Prevotella sp.]